MYATLREEGPGQQAVLIIDQTELPLRAVERRLGSLAEVADAIRSMQVRGAPLIGASAAYGVALAMNAASSDEALADALACLAATRPTAVNLHWALARMRQHLLPLSAAARAAAAWQEARRIAAEDAATNAAIGQHGLPLLQEIAARQGRVRVMTHCNAGWLATVAHGTALAPVYAAHAAGVALEVWVSETRPRNQGLLTAWELAQAGIAHRVLADNAAGLLMMQGQVDLVIVGADRIAANGDVANKVGTYLKALAAEAHGIPFYVAAPRSTIDMACAQGARIPIEERAPGELGHAADLAVINPAFDITPAALIDGVISECGIQPADRLAALFQS